MLEIEKNAVFLRKVHKYFPNQLLLDLINYPDKLRKNKSFNSSLLKQDEINNEIYLNKERFRLYTFHINNIIILSGFVFFLSMILPKPTWCAQL